MDSTNIECKLLREGGTYAEIDGTEYHFAPLADGAHVAAVTSDEHIARFLSISDAYRLYRGKETPGAAAVYTVKISDKDGIVTGFGLPEAPSEPVVMIVDSVVPAATLYDAPTHPASFDIHGTTYTFEQVTELAQQANGFAPAEWYELSTDARADLIDEELEKIDAAGPVAKVAAEPAPAALTREQLVEQYEAKFDKKPHYRWSDEKIIDALAE